MKDEDPPRKLYGLKPKDDFARANPPPGTKSDDPTSVQDHFRIATRHDGPLLEKKETYVENQVHRILARNIEKDKEAGLYDVKPGVDSKKQERVIKFWVPIITIDVLLAGFTILHWNDRDLLVGAVVGLGALLNFGLYWRTWAFRTH